MSKFTLTKYENNLVLSWDDFLATNQISTQDADLTSEYHLLILIDSSGSMNMVIDLEGHRSRLTVVKDTISQVLDLLSIMIQQGYKIHLIIKTFNTIVETVYQENHALKQSEIKTIKERVRMIYPGSSTVMLPAIKEIQEQTKKIQQKAIENNKPIKIFRIILSDGYDTSGINRLELLSQINGCFECCMGIGNHNGYDNEFLTKLSRNQNVYGSPSAKILTDNLVAHIFQSTTICAENVMMESNLKLVSTLPSITNSSDNRYLYQYQLDDFQFFRLFNFQLDNSEFGEEFRIKWINPKTKEEELQIITSNDIVFSSSSILTKVLNLQFEIQMNIKALEENDFLNPEYLATPEGNRGAWLRKYFKTYLDQIKLLVEEANSQNIPSEHPLIINLQGYEEEVRKLDKYQESDEYLHLLRTASQTATYMTPSYSTRYSEIYTTIDPSPTHQEVDLTCFICGSGSRQVVPKYNVPNQEGKVSSCSHLLSCPSCFSEVIRTKGKAECPTCRTIVTKCYEIDFPTYDQTKKELKCLDCGHRQINSFNRPCNHAIYCSKCFPKHIGQECQAEGCQKTITHMHHFKLP